MNNLYTRTAYELSKQLMKRYTTSFSLSSRLFGKDIRPHIFAIYAVVRIADEIVDTHRGDDALAQLDTLEKETINALANSYHTNPLLHAFAQTARRCAIDQSRSLHLFLTACGWTLRNSILHKQLMNSIFTAQPK